MSMVCPECHGSFDQTLQCPACSVRLQYRSGGRAAGAAPAASGQPQWQNTPWGRIVVGILLSQGLGHGLQMLCTAGLLAASEESSRTVWGTLFGLVLLQALHALSLMVGAGVTAAGQRRGLFLGGVVGLTSGCLFLAAQLLQGERPADASALSEPVLALAFGALGGLLGSTIWRPLPALRMPASPADKARPRPAPVAPSALVGPIAWGRVLVGLGVVACAVLWPAVILNFVVEYSQGRFRLESHLQAQLVTWEIAGVLTLLAGALAGATTRNGIKHGLLVGLGGAVLLVGNYLGNRAAVLEQTLLMVACVLSLTVAGGWFGGHLFPPIAARRRKTGPAY
jgi:hypothetical protein